MPRPLEKLEVTYWALPGYGTTKKTVLHQSGIHNEGSFPVSPYSMIRASGLSFGKTANNLYYVVYTCDGSYSGHNVVNPDEPVCTPSFNQAYARFKEKATGEQSQVGAMFAEWSQSLSMITRRALQLRKGYSHLRRGRFRKFLGTFGLRAKRKHRSKVRNLPREASSLWLEYWFGWSPLLGDIYNACAEMSEPPPDGTRYQGSGKGHKLSRQVGGTLITADSRWTVRQGAKVRLDNPNLYLLSQLGLANPVAVAWEVIPFSFMVDWVAKVGDFLESFTDFLGCSVTDSYNNWLLKSDTTLRANPGIGENRNVQVRFVRRNGIQRPIPNWRVFANLGTSKTRSATAVSLLVQVLARP